MLAGASTVQKLQMIIKNTEVVKAVKLLGPLVQDLKRISFDQEGKESHEKKKDVKEVMRNCRSVNDILGSFPEFEEEDKDCIRCFVCKTKFSSAEEN